MTQTIFESRITSLPLLGRGKVRDIYAVGDDKLLIIVSDRLSAFDVILPDPIPDKGHVLTAIADFWLIALYDYRRVGEARRHRIQRWIRWQTGSLMPSMIVHVIHNSLLLTVAHYQDHLQGWSLGAVEASHLPMPWLAGFGVCLAAGVLLLLFRGKDASAVV